MLVPPNAIVLNSDHEQGVCLPIDLSEPGTVQQMLERAIPLRRA